MSMKTFLKKHIPPTWQFRLMHWKKRLLLQSFRTDTYSADGEDIVLEKLFRNQKTGLYVDVGCFHPRLFSNTYKLWKRGWHGINIDPNPEVMSLYRHERPRDTNLELGVAKTAEEKVYYNFTNAGVNTFDEAHAKEKGAKEWNQLVSETKITCQPLSEILAEHTGGQTIDVLDVDVEGMDLEVLQSSDWGRFRPRVVLVEDRDFRTQVTASDAYLYLTQQGYVFHAYNNITLIMLDKNF